jgi:L,D-peptidoglycan transpeptidase YkuD (ErfK/YbiS/YcfS/YnhG family)
MHASRNRPVSRFRDRIAIPALVLLACTVASCAHTPRAGTDLPWRDARQLVLVTSAGWDADGGELRRYERDDTGDWREVGTATGVTLGRNGSAWGLGLHPAQSGGPRKQEGDGRAPAGVFAIGTAFGYGNAARTGLPYQAMDIDDWCIDVPQSPLYNRIVDAGEVGRDAIEGSTEPMRRDLHVDGDVRYRWGFVIGHNPDAIPGRGSCIFAHLWRTPGESTAGCTAMAEPAMLELLAWLDPGHAPVFVLLPEAEYRRLAGPWNLPARTTDHP